MSKCLDFNITSWFEQDCTEYLRNLDDDEKSQYFETLFTNFYSDNSGIYLPNTEFQRNQIPSRNDIEFQYLLIDICNSDNNGKFCRPYLLDHCIQYSRIDTENLIVKKLCGCYLDSNKYDGSVGRACDFICTGYDTIRYYEEGSDYASACISNVCVIDSVTVTVINSNAGDITFNQICPYCAGSSNCKCVINDINIITQNSSIGKVEINQECSETDSTCFETSIDGIRREVPCETYFGELGTNPTLIEQKKTIYQRVGWITGIASIVLLVLFIVCLVFLYKIKPQYIRYGIDLDVYQNENGDIKEVVNFDNITVDYNVNPDKIFF